MKMKDASVLLKNMLQTKTDDGFQLTKESKDNYEITHQRYQQYYKGVKVEGSEYLVHSKKGNIETINGNFQEIYTSSVMPSINEQQALAKALGFVNAKKYKWEDNETEKFLKQNTNNPKATYYPKAELVISKDFLIGSESFKLSYKFTISSLQPNNEQLIFVDAITGDIINNQSLISDVNTPCIAQTRYSGNLPITGDSFTGGFRLRELRNGVTVQTLNCSSQSNYANAIDFTNNNVNWIIGSWATIGQNQGALDAHWAEESVLDFWRTTFNRNSINGNGINVVGYVHYFDPLSPAGWPNNAQWDGTNNVMRYGDGDGVTFRSLTALDVVSHEFGHGITQYTANLGTGSNGFDEAAALNEGFSDI
jgi:bacillolysin